MFGCYINNNSTTHSITSGASDFIENREQRIGSVYKKAMFVEYEDPSFNIRKQHSFDELHYGLSGPPIKVEVGDNVNVLVMNKASRPYSFLANGVGMTKYNEGAVYKNDRNGKNDKNNC